MNEYVFLCDGQGSVSPGFGKDLYDNDKVFKTAFEEVNSLLNIDCKELTWGKLKFKVKQNPYYAHIYCLCNQYALFKSLISRGIHCKIISGHSLGEIIAIILSGAVTLEDGTEWISYRGELFLQNMKSNTEMVALIGKKELSFSLVDQLSKGLEIYIANHNSANQIIVSVKKTDLPVVFMEAINKKLRPVNLDLGNGCHSKFVEPIEEKLNEKINTFVFSTPSTKFYSASFNQFVEDPVLLKHLSKKHLLKDVEWESSICNLIAAGNTEFIELGYSKILKGLLLDIDRKVTTNLALDLLAQVKAVR